MLSTLDVEADLAADDVGQGVDEHLGLLAGEVLVVELPGPGGRGRSPEVAVVALDAKPGSS
jgi:hypothetical protein